MTSSLSYILRRRDGTTLASWGEGRVCPHRSFVRVGLPHASLQIPGIRLPASLDETRRDHTAHQDEWARVRRRPLYLLHTVRAVYKYRSNEEDMGYGRPDALVLGRLYWVYPSDVYVLDAGTRNIAVMGRGRPIQDIEMQPEDGTAKPRLSSRALRR